MADESLNPDLANKLREALGMAKKDQKELSAMASAYGKSLGVASEEINKATVNREKEIRLVDVLHSKMQRVGEESKRGMQLQNLSNQISETANDLASEQNKLMADLVLKQTMIQTGLEGSFAEQAKNYKLLLDQGEITEELYNSAVKRLQEEQHFNHELKDQLELQESIAESILEIKEEAEAWKKSFTKIFETAKAIGRDPAIMGAFLMKEGIKRLEKAHESFEKLRESGLSSGQAIEAQFKGLSLSSMLGLSDTKGVMEGVVQEFGNVNALSSETVNELGTMAHHLGITGQEALKLNAALSQLPGETSETAASAMEHTAHLAEAQGIAGSKVFSDMAKNTGAMALYSKGGAEAFGKTAVELHKMGVEIATASKMADGLLNFEDSINKQMEASVLLGKEINLDKARELALSGDLAGSTAEVLKNIGGSAEFDKMNVMQKKALAEATGMTVEELQKSIDAQEESNKYFGEGSNIAENALGAMMEYGGKAAGFFKENGELLMASVQFLQSQNLTKLKGYAVDAAHWVKEKAHMLWVKAQSMLRMGKGAAAAGGGLAASAAGKTPEIKTEGVDKASKIKGGGGFAKAMKEMASGLKAMGNAKVLFGIGNLILFAPAAVIGVMGLPFLALIAALGKFIGGGLKGLASGLKALANPQVAIGIGLLSLLVLSVGAGMMMFGIGVGIAAAGMSLLVTAIGEMPIENLLILPIALSGIALGMGLLAVASLAAAPGLILASFGLAAMVVPLAVVSAIAETGAVGMLGEALGIMGNAGPGLALVGASLVGIAGGLSLMALSGLMALPIIGALIGLAAVAPALSGLMGGGGGEEEDKMQVIADKLDQLIAVASKGGDINMDGRKVGEVIRLGLNTSNVR